MKGLDQVTMPQEPPVPGEPAIPEQPEVGAPAEEGETSPESLDMGREQAAIEQEIAETTARLHELREGFDGRITSGVQRITHELNALVAAIRELGGSFEDVKEGDVRKLSTPHAPYWNYGLDSYHIGAYSSKLYNLLLAKEMPDYDQENWENESSEEKHQTVEIYERVQEQYVKPIERASQEMTSVVREMGREKAQLAELEEVRKGIESIRTEGLMAFLRKNAGEKVKNKE